MASSMKRKRIHDVFLSFRGTDVRKNFLSHLYKALVQNGIDTFEDSEELRKGDQISPVLMKAIEQSHIAIIVFSKDYASSKWCLEEVVKIMECKEQRDLIVLPVFYKVDPKEVRGGRESYGRALAMHESKFGKDSEEVRKWKKALFDAGSLSGWHFNDGDESQLIQSIVNETSTRLARPPVHVAKHPVGINSRVVELKSMLKLGSDDDIVMVGLWGQGGIGKSTLVRALYNTIFRQFEGSCLLANIREASKDSKDLVSLQEKLLFEILSLQRRLKVSCVNTGINLLQHRLRHKKVLLILDDVDDQRQLDALVGEGKWFGNGSRIIVTTRDKHLLTSHGIDQDRVYKVRALNNKEACKLLTKYAFPTHQKLEIKRDLVDSVLNHVGGLPLALEVLGSFLCGRREDEWESTLRKLSKVPNNKINDVLKISYDGLEENEKEIFLDIACFFKWRKSEYVKKVLNSCDLEAEIGLKILIERSLISNEWDVLQMHDLIQSMGKDIVRQGCRDDPRRHSRLWRYDDVADVLSSDMDFQQLRYLKLSDCESLVSTPNLSFTPNLKELKLWNCKNLVEAHKSIAYHDKLQVLHFKWCLELHVFPNMLKLKNLRDLNLSVCPKLERFPDIPHILEGLKELSILHTAIKELPASIENLVSLEEMLLDIGKNSVSIPSNIYKLQRLQCFKSALGPIVFPNLIDSANACMKVGLSNLKVLDLVNCNLFEVEFLEDLSCFPLLETLILSGNNITSLPTSISKRDRLSELSICYCHQLREIPKLPPFLKLLLANGCESLQTNGHLTSIDQWVHRGLTVVDIASIAKNSHCTIFLPKGEMPKWFQPVEDCFISFMASKDLYDKFLGLIFYDVCNNEGCCYGLLFHAYFNGKYESSYEADVTLVDPSGIFITYLAPSDLWKGVHFDQIDGSYAQFSIRIEFPGVIEKSGFRIICKQLDDNLKAEIRDCKLIDPIFLYEVGHDSTNPEAQSSHIHENNPTEIGLSRNLQESSHMLENRLIEFDLDCPPRVMGADINMSYREYFSPGHLLPGDPRSLGNIKLKIVLEE